MLFLGHSGRVGNLPEDDEDLDEDLDDNQGESLLDCKSLRASSAGQQSLLSLPTDACYCMCWDVMILEENTSCN